MKIKRILASVFAGVIAFGGCLGLAGCKEIPTLVYGDFIYTVEKEEQESGEKVVQIAGLSQQGKEKEIIIVPEFIDGYRVVSLGEDWGIGSFGGWESTNLKKAFIPFFIWIARDVFADCPNLEKIITLRDRALEYNERHHRDVFITSFYYTGNDTNFFESYYAEFYFSNVSFMYNYETEKNKGYYWIDDLDYGSKIEVIPEKPTRENYTFGGWYKEAECINEWDFEIDTLPEEKKNENGEVIYQETKLYAKWIKN